eukprot:2473157-Prymnesium_polylepis.1
MPAVGHRGDVRRQVGAVPDATARQPELPHTFLLLTTLRVQKEAEEVRRHGRRERGAHPEECSVGVGLLGRREEDIEVGPNIAGTLDPDVERNASWAEAPREAMMDAGEVHSLATVNRQRSARRVARVLRLHLIGVDAQNIPGARPLPYLETKQQHIVPTANGHGCAQRWTQHEDTTPRERRCHAHKPRSLTRRDGQGRRQGRSRRSDVVHRRRSSAQNV